MRSRAFLLYNTRVSFFKTLQEKDKATKAHFAFAVAIGITGIVGLIWLTTLPARFAALSEVEEVAVKEIKASGTNAGDSFGSIATGARTQMASLVDAFKGLTETFKKAEEEVPGVTTLDTSEFYTPSTVTEEIPPEETTTAATTSPDQATTTTPKIDKTERIILIGTTTTKTSE